MTRRQAFYALGVTLTALLTAGCGDEPPAASFSSERQAASAGPPPAPAALAPAPLVPAGDDTLATPDQLTEGADGSARDPGDVSSPGSGDALASDTPMPTAYRHWLTVSQFGAQVKLRVNGVAQGGFAASNTSDITMVMHPGSNTITVEYTPKSADAWARVYVTRDPPLPQLTLFDSTSLHAPAVAAWKPQSDTKPKPLTQTFTVIVH